MNSQEKIAFKNNLKQYCRSVIEQRIKAAKNAIDSAQQSANSEEKSSAGDKYETSRAMGHLEKDMHSAQLAENVKELAELHSIDTNLIYTEAVAGAFIQCAHLAFFIAVGLGKQISDGKIILFVSPNAPIAKLLQHKKASDHFLFNGVDTVIDELY